MYNRTKASNQIKSIVINKHFYSAVLLLITVSLISALLLPSSFFAQEKDNKPDKKSKVKFLIRAIDAKEKKHKATFNVGEKIYIETLIKNDSDENYPHTVISKYYNHQLNLQKVGEKRVKEHRKDKIESISRGQGKPKFFSDIEGIPIKPGESRVVGMLDLNDWYENIEPGEYRLTIQYRSNPGMPVLISNRLFIEIIQPEN
ncbi:MAG: hypothetical protein ACR2J3_07035 [Aridibacter sp.]